MSFLFRIYVSLGEQSIVGTYTNTYGGGDSTSKLSISTQYVNTDEILRTAGPSKRTALLLYHFVVPRSLPSSAQHGGLPKIIVIIIPPGNGLLRFSRRRRRSLLPPPPHRRLERVHTSHVRTCTPPPGLLAREKIATAPGQSDSRLIIRRGGGEEETCMLPSVMYDYYVRTYVYRDNYCTETGRRTSKGTGSGLRAV